MYLHFEVYGLLLGEVKLLLWKGVGGLEVSSAHTSIRSLVNDAFSRRL